MELKKTIARVATSNVASEVLGYADRVNNCKLKLLFINDGPGLLLGSMWDDYCNLEDQGSGRIMVATLKMIPETSNSRMDSLRALRSKKEPSK